MKSQIALCVVCLVGCGDKTQEATKGLVHGIAVLNSDYHSTALTLLDPNTETVVDPCLTSGSVTPRLSLALSGDAVLPSQANSFGALALVDRTNDAVVWVDPSDCTVQGQLAVSPGFDGNPHDILGISASKSYVTLYSPNSDGTSGNSVLIINPQTLQITGSIELSSLATQDGNGLTLLARPDRAVQANGMVFVSLGNLSADYSCYGSGRVAVIDPETDALVGAIHIDSAQSCSGLAAQGATLAVGCDGNFNDPNQSMYSGVFVYDVTTPQSPALSRSISASQLAQQTISSSTLALTQDHVYFVATAATDAVFADTTAFYQESAPYVLGAIVLEGDDVFVADATTQAPAILHGPSGNALQHVVAAPKSLLPPRNLLVF